MSIILAPNKAAAGRINLCSEVFNINLVICGAASPINAIGPAKAVITPVNKLVAMISWIIADYLIETILLA